MQVRELLRQLKSLPKDADIQVSDIEWGSMDDEGFQTWSGDFEIDHYYGNVFKLQVR